MKTLLDHKQDNRLITGIILDLKSNKVGEVLALKGSRMRAKITLYSGLFSRSNKMELDRVSKLNSVELKSHSLNMCHDLCKHIEDSGFKILDYNLNTTSSHKFMGGRVEDIHGIKLNNKKFKIFWNV